MCLASITLNALCCFDMIHVLLLICNRLVFLLIWYMNRNREVEDRIAIVISENQNQTTWVIMTMVWSMCQTVWFIFSQRDWLVFGNIIRFGEVCRSGHVIVSDEDQIMALGHKEVLPWLLLPESDQSEDGNRQFFDLSTGGVYTLTTTSSWEKVRRFFSWPADNSRIRFAIPPVWSWVASLVMGSTKEELIQLCSS